MKLAGLALASCLILALAWASPQGEFDLIIRNGRIIDGSGNPWYAADIGIRGGKIAAVGKLCAGPACPADRVLDAAGLIVSPGFIDVHTHSETGIKKVPTADNYLFDGVTSIITGNCGGSEPDLNSFFNGLRESGISINLGSLVGHNTVRNAVMGSEQRDPTADELAKMEKLVEEAMKAGAVGLSTGLIYIPGAYAKTPEVVALARVAARYGGIYTSHIRNEGNDEQGGVFQAIDEAIEIGRRAAIPVEISHFKVAGKLVWGKSTQTIEKVENARRGGIDVTVDQYPYSASSTGLSVLLPSWAYAGGKDQFLKRLADPPTRRKIASEARQVIFNRSGFRQLDYAVVARCEWDPSLEGKSISQINLQKGKKKDLDAEIGTVMEMLEKGSVQMVYHSMNEDDVERIMRYPNTMVGSDGGVIEFGKGAPHPRSYGTNARVLGRYVRERKTLTLEDAIRRMTSLPARRFGLSGRGLLQPGMWADVNVFDENTVSDQATFPKPHAYSKGFRHVLVNGVPVIENGKHTGAKSGQILTGPWKPANQ
jgi:N-acyl-D-amino-acid deacylase